MSSLASILTVSAGNFIGMLASAIALIIYSRFMGPAEFGIFSVAFAFMQIVVRIADFGTNMAAERTIARAYDHPSRRDGLIQTTLWLKTISYLIIFILMWNLAPWITLDLLHINNIGLIRSAVLLSSGTIIFEYATLVFQATHRFDLVARITIAQGLGKLIFSLLLIWQGMLNSFLGLLIYGILPGVGALLGFVKKPLSSFSLPPRWRIQLKQILSVAKWTAVAALAITVADNLDILMVQSLMSSYDVGLWSGVVRLATFANLVGWSIGSVLNVRVARYDRIDHLREYLRKAWKLSLAVFLGILIFIPLAGFAIHYSIGSSYIGATIPLQILLVSIAISSATVPYIALFYVFDSPQYYALSGILQTVLLILGDLYFIPLYGLVGSAWVRVAVRLALFIFTLYYAKRSYFNHFSKLNLHASLV